MQIRWLKGALRNLEQAVEYIAQDGPKAAQAVARAIYETVRNLKTYPQLGKPWRIEGVYSIVVPRTPYFVRYRITPEAVEILRIHHQAQRWPDE
jgi:toxin ParE1/3/4